jgi:ribosomal protein L12E/L44/L45/RPP1/RPP2
MNKKLWLSMLMAFMLVLGLAACGGGTDDAKEDAKTEDKSSGTEDKKDEAKEEPKQDTLVFGRIFQSYKKHF